MAGTARDQFVHLHVHTEYSMLDGAAKIDPLTSEAAAMGMPAIAMTDHGNVFGAYDFYTRAQANGIKPIIGMEGYYTPGSRFDRGPFDFGSINDGDNSEEGRGNKGKAAYTHMTLLATTTQGMHNLFRLSSLASLEGQYRKPRFDRETLERYHEGLVATTGCPSGEVNMWLRAGREEKARAAAADFRDIFGPGNFYVEVMDHGLELERRTRQPLLKIARDLDLPLLATNDLHYTHQHDSVSHEALLCIQTGDRLSNPGRFRLSGDGYYLKSPEEMRALFVELPEACDNTLAVAERCEVSFNTGADLMPRFPVPVGEDESSWFVKEVERGLHVRYPAGIPDAARKRADYEVAMILQMGFPSYFLVVADLIAWSRAQGIRVGPGRGSAAGSLVAYVMRITELDPLVHGLLFERFLNPERVSMPDIDIDFDERRRGEVMAYVNDKYGEANVAQVVTYGTIKAKAAIKDAARVLDKTFALSDSITKAMPPAVMGKDIPLAGIFDREHKRYGEAIEFRTKYDADAEVKEVVDTARSLEGLKRQWGVHACAVIMSSVPLMDTIPVMKREQDGAIITQFDYPTCEALGLLKMDFLGLRNLTVIDDALRNIKANHGLDIDIDNLAFDDPSTYQLLSRGDTLGVFQLDGTAMRSLLRSLKPDTFDDITAVIALYRPGPMGANAHNDYADRKNGRKPVVPLHAELAEPLAEALGETYGLVVYQEQVMAIAQRVAGYSLARADLLRRAMSKKKKAELDAQYDGFSSGMADRGYSAAAIQTLWNILLPFCDYGFNKSHGAGYAVVSYWTAYLKANFPVEYMAALLTSVRDDKDKMAIYLAECRRMGITVLPPDVNSSTANFTPVDKDIRFGLAAVRGVGTGVVASIVRSRADKGAFTSFHDFLRKIDQTACKRNVVESLIKSGGFDSLLHSRRGLIAIHAEAIEAVVDVKRNEAMGQFDLFGDLGAMGGDDPASRQFEVSIPEGEWSKRELLSFERDMLGLYVSDHPLRGVEHVLATVADTTIAQVHEGVVEDDAIFTIAGILTNVVRKVDKKGRPWATATVEDLEGGLDVLLFSSVYSQVGHQVADDQIVALTGRLKRRDEKAEMFVADLVLPDLSKDDSGPVTIQLPALRCTPPIVERLREVLRSHPGVVPVHLRLLNGGRITTVKLDEALRVTRSPALVGDLKALLGTESVAS